MSKQDALTYAIQLEIERHVRNVARTGTHDKAGINYTAEWEDNAIHATNGGGTNSASVTRYDGTVLYRSDDYGKYVRVYRHGKWASRLVDYSYALFEARAKQNDLELAQQEQQEAFNFATIDY